ncbi:GGDEF domain-containing protein [Jiella avicenniae]|uniref:diguanylate cyclase n=1 Tax=Jiella avicenniae TaxID=2907202 RepID=A0A9X1P052_9HYPH|nr:GGDEF domain-containing protein [Jiella avicenniae]MCE7027640.1 GGDEF domain-containing protein [Jiella avicenniae]MCE7028682.1 GGDEF domain-containing protein [Jiella avicenniae]
MQLDHVDRLILERGYRLAFPQSVETTYHAYRSRFRRRLSTAMLGPTLVCYNVFLVVDYVLLPETFRLSVALHFLLVSPIIILSSLCMQSDCDPRTQDVCTALGPLAMIGQIMVIYSYSASEAAQHYHYLAIFVLIYMNLLFRMEYWHAIVASAFALMVYVGTLIVAGAPLPVLVIGMMASAAAAYLSLSGNRQIQRDARHGFLRRMQDKLRIEEAKTEASRDALTGLFNRRRLEAVFAELALGSSSSTIAILMIDVDHFKQFNDQNGHLAGDLCLREIADLLVRLTRRDRDLVVRFGGEEFLVLLRSTSPDDALRIAERIRMEIEGLGMRHADGETAITVSIGAMVDDVRTVSPETLIAAADAALYAAKQAGRNRVWPPPPPDPAGDLSESLEGNEREGVGHPLQNLKPFRNEVADVAIV